MLCIPLRYLGNLIENRHGFEGREISNHDCQITAFLEPNRHQCRHENNENKKQMQRKTKSIVKSLAPKMQ